MDVPPAEGVGRIQSLVSPSGVYADWRRARMCSLCSYPFDDTNAGNFCDGSIAADGNRRLCYKIEYAPPSTAGQHYLLSVANQLYHRFLYFYDHFNATEEMCTNIKKMELLLMNNPIGDLKPAVAEQYATDDGKRLFGYRRLHWRMMYTPPYGGISEPQLRAKAVANMRGTEEEFFQSFISYSKFTEEFAALRNRFSGYAKLRDSGSKRRKVAAAEEQEEVVDEEPESTLQPVLASGTVLSKSLSRAIQSAKQELETANTISRQQLLVLSKNMYVCFSAVVSMHRMKQMEWQWVDYTNRMLGLAVAEERLLDNTPVIAIPPIQEQPLVRPIDILSPPPEVLSTTATSTVAQTSTSSSTSSSSSAAATEITTTPSTVPTDILASGPQFLSIRPELLAPERVQPRRRIVADDDSSSDSDSDSDDESPDLEAMRKLAARRRAKPPPVYRQTTLQMPPVVPLSVPAPASPPTVSPSSISLVVPMTSTSTTTTSTSSMMPPARTPAPASSSSSTSSVPLAGQMPALAPLPPMLSTTSPEANMVEHDNKAHPAWIKGLTISQNVVVPPRDAGVSVARFAPTDPHLPSRWRLKAAEQLQHQSLVDMFRKEDMRFLHIGTDTGNKISNLFFFAMPENPLTGEYSIYFQWLFTTYGNWMFPFGIKKVRKAGDEKYRIRARPLHRFILYRRVGESEWSVLDHFIDDKKSEEPDKPGKHDKRDKPVELRFSRDIFRFAIGFKKTVDMMDYWNGASFKKDFTKTDKVSMATSTIANPIANPFKLVLKDLLKAKQVADYAHTERFVLALGIAADLNLCLAPERVLRNEVLTAQTDLPVHFLGDNGSTKVTDVHHVCLYTTLNFPNDIHWLVEQVPGHDNHIVLSNRVDAPGMRSGADGPRWSPAATYILDTPLSTAGQIADFGQPVEQNEDRDDVPPLQIIPHADIDSPASFHRSY